ncbi:MAG: metallophosphatase family protein [Prolixibacteraceae bacterium]|nr:metallophosphatase family protein [Prolixibacteraceae bacterium]
MRRIALLSDTHGFLDDQMIRLLGECDEIWHAGDIGSFSVTDRLVQLKPLKAVCGNIDGAELRVQFPTLLRFQCEGVDVLITHIGGYPGHYERKLLPLLKSNPPKLFIAGHSHILKVIFDPKYQLLHINPGAAGQQGFHLVRTMVRFTIDGDQIKDMEVVEFGKRVTLQSETGSTPV